MFQFRAACLLGFSLLGCASTSGRAWIDSRIEERTAPSTLELAQTEPVSEARPRLNHTVTLGESYASSPAVAATPAGAPGAPPVQVNVQTHVPVTVNHYGGYGYGYGYGYGAARTSTPTSSAVRSSGSSTSTSQPVGTNWPAIPDYGPKAMR